MEISGISAATIKGALPAKKILISKGQLTVKTIKKKPKKTIKMLKPRMQRRTIHRKTWLPTHWH